MYIGLFILGGVVVALLIGVFVLRLRLNRMEARKWVSKQ